MNLTPVALIAAFLASAAAASAQAYYEPFRDEDGASAPAGWELLNPKEGTSVVSTGSLEFPGIKVPEGNRFTLSAKAPEESRAGYQSPEIPGLETGNVFYSFLLSVEELGKMAEDGSHTGLIMLADRKADSAVGGKSQAAVGMFAKGKEAYGLCVSSGHTGLKSGAQTADKTLDIGTAHLVVVGFERSGTSGVARLWIDPKPGEPQPEADAEAEPDRQLAKVINCFFIGGQTTLMTMPGRFTIDEIRVGGSWEEVVPAK
jgi:hypothetical protein